MASLAMTEPSIALREATDSALMEYQESRFRILSELAHVIDLQSHIGIDGLVRGEAEHHLFQSNGR